MPDSTIADRARKIAEVSRQAIRRLLGLQTRQRDLIKKLDEEVDQKNVEKIRKQLSSK